MGWFDRLLGREQAKTPDGEELKGFAKRGWESISTDRRASTTQQYLETVAAALGITEAVVVPRPEEHRADLRGSASGFPLRITVDYSGSVNDITFRYAELKREGIDLEYDPDMPAKPVSQTVEPWDPSDKQIILAPQIFLEGSDAEKAAEAFRELPQQLQQRVLTEIRRLRIRYFRSRSEEFDITMHDDANEVGEPVQWLVDVMKLALEVSGARGAVPPNTAKGKPIGKPAPAAPTTPTPTNELAQRIARQLFGATVVPRESGKKIDVRWTEQGVPVRIIVDLDFDDLDIEARAENFGSSFDLYREDEVTIEKVPENRDEWEDTERTIFFAKSVYVNASDGTARHEAALLQGMGTSLLDEVVRTMEELQLDHIGVNQQVLAVNIDDLDSITDDGAAAIRVAKLLARMAKALPRGEVKLTKQPQSCASCHGMWFSSATQLACVHCGNR